MVAPGLNPLWTDDMPDDATPTPAAIDSVEALEALYGKVSRRAALKTLAKLDKHCRAFIALSPFVVIGTAGDVSPKGDPPGFVKVIDDTTLAIPDRKGNNRLDGMRNLLDDPRVALLFFVPGVNETLRVNGRAEISADPDLLAGFEEKGHVPATALIVHVEEAFLHCAKALVRSRLWDADAQVDRSVLPGAGEMLADQIGDTDRAGQQASYEESIRKGLY